MLLRGESFAGDHEPTPSSPEQIVAVAPMPGVLFCTRRRHSLEIMLGEAHDMERIRDLDGVGQHHVERAAMRRAGFPVSDFSMRNLHASRWTRGGPRSTDLPLGADRSVPGACPERGPVMGPHTARLWLRQWWRGHFHRG